MVCGKKSPASRFCSVSPQAEAMESFERTLGIVIAETRRSNGLSQEALAFACKLHPTYISQLERGLKSPTVRVVRLISQALGTKASILLGIAESRM